MKNNLLLILQTSEVTSENWLSSPGVIGTIVLIFIVLFLGIFIFIKRLNRYVDVLEDNKKDLSEEDFERRLINLDKAEVDHILKARQQGFKDEEKPADTVEAPSKYSGFIKKIIDPKNPLFD
jgi:cytochrome c oxidase cbb3-type subunit 1